MGLGTAAVAGDDKDEDDGFIRVGSDTRADSSLRREQPEVWARRKRLLASKRFVFPSHAFNSGHVALLLLQSLGNAATSRSLVGLKKSVVAPSTDNTQKGRTSPITPSERFSEVAQWARHITILSRLFDELCDLYTLECFGVSLRELGHNSQGIPGMLGSINPSKTGDGAEATKRWSKIILGSIMTRDFLASNTDVWSASMTDFKQSIIPLLDGEGGSVNGRERDETNVDALISLLTDRGGGGSHGLGGIACGSLGVDSVVAREAGQTALSQEDRSAAEGVAIVGWKMSRAARLTAPKQRSAVLRKYILRAVAELLAEAVERMEHTMVLINHSQGDDHATASQIPRRTSPAFVQRWRDAHMNIKEGEGNVAFRHWADLNEYLLIDSAHKGKHIDLDVKPLYHDTVGPPSSKR